MTKEVRIATSEGRDLTQEGYFLTETQLLDLLRDYIVDSRAGLVSSSEIYLEDWLKNN